MNLRKAVKNILSLALSPLYAGVGHILMFHRVGSPPPWRIPGASPLYVSPAFLEQMIQFFLQRQVEFLSPADLPQRLAQKGGRRFVIFSFDDGYVDNLTTAYPIFQKYDLPFTIHISSGFVDGTSCPWRFPLEELVFSQERLSVRLDGSQLELDCSAAESRQRAFTLLRRALKFSTPKTLPGNLEGIFAPYGIDPLASTRSLLLNWEQIAKLGQDARITFGAHSANHYLLSRLTDEELHSEITLSKQRLEDCLGRRVQHFAYPFGGAGEAGRREFQAVSQACFTTAFTTRAANLFPQHLSHLTALPRFDASAMSSLDVLTDAIRGWTPARRYRFRRVIVE